jgi:hypothetical protein
MNIPEDAILHCHRRANLKSYLIFLRSLLQLIVATNVVPSSLILFTVIMEATRSSDISVLTRVTRRNIPEDGILHSHRCGNFKSHITLNDWAL